MPRGPCWPSGAPWCGFCSITSSPNAIRAFHAHGLGGWKFVKKEVPNSRHQDFGRFRAAIDGCPAELTTTHRDKLAAPLTHNFQTYNDVSLLKA